MYEDIVHHHYIQTSTLSLITCTNTGHRGTCSCLKNRAQAVSFMLPCTSEVKHSSPSASSSYR
uniref:Uncharacterized protein n=1 Tax=Arundo donax TaxID=35708 RepID=A0A0A9H8K2_ARUDO